MTLSIQLFGQPRLLLDSVPLPFNAPPKTLPLLAYLLLHRAQALERQQVSFALWPDDAEAAARANLRRHLHQLQRALPPARPGRPWLLGDTRTIRWNPQADAWLDIGEFERLASDPHRLAEAVQLYAGDLLETVYDDWVFFERERLRELYFNCLGQLVYQGRTRRDYPAALSYAQQLLGRDPFREDTLRQLIALRYESGDRAGALQEYEAFERRLRMEMGMATMPETRSLYESVLRNARLPGAAPAAAPEAAAEPSKPCAAPILPFTGRTNEMDHLAACWNRAAHGHGGLVLIGGEAGVGKTRLARELALLAEKQGGRVLYGGTTPGEPRPYQAVSEALQAALPLLASLESASSQLAALAGLVPELKARRSLPDLPALEPDRERTRLFDAIATCLAKLSEPRPLLIILEDWHWAGEASVSQLEFLARRAADRPLLLAGTYRDEETPRIHPLRLLRRRLQSENLAVHLPLGRLSPQAVETMVSQISAGNPELGERLYRESEGNPLFVEMLWQSWQEAGPAGERLSEAPLPGGMRAVIARRLERLEATAHSYAEVAAVLGPAFDAEAAREVGGWDEAQAYDALRELLDCRLVRDAEGRSQFDYIFAHHLIQAALYNETPPAKRKRRHRRAAEVLESLYPERMAEIAGELAAHYDRGGVPGQAIPHYLAAARQRLAVYADAEALAAIGRALQLAQDEPADSRTVIDLLLLREGLHYRRGERTEQLADLQRLEELAATDPALTCEVLKRRILYHKGKDEHPLHKEYMEKLKAQARLTGSRLWEAYAVYAEGNYLKLVNEYMAAIIRTQEAYALFQELQNREGQVRCCCNLANIYIDFRQSTQAEAWAQKALALCEGKASYFELMNTLWNLSANGLITKDLERCLKFGEKLLAEAERANDRVWQAAAQRIMGMAYSRLFRIAEARQCLEIAYNFYQLSQKPKGCALTLESLGNLEIAVGGFAAARQYHQQGLEILERLNDPNGITSALINLSCVASFQDDFEAEGAYAQRAIPVARQIQNRYLEAVALQNLAEAERAAGDLLSSQQHLDQALLLMADPSQVEERASILADLAITHWKASDLPLALQYAEQVLELYPQVEGTDDNVHRYLWSAVRVIQAAGQAARASQALARAHQTYQKELAAIPDAESRQAYANIRHNRQIAAAFERGEWL